MKLSSLVTVFFLHVQTFLFSSMIDPSLAVVFFFTILHEQVPPGFPVVEAPTVVNFGALVGGAAFVVESVNVSANFVGAAAVVLVIVFAVVADDVE